MQYSGQTTVTTAGTAVPLISTELRSNGSLAIRALSTNTGVVYIGNDGANDVSSSTGFELSAEDILVFEYVGDLRSIYVDAATDGDKVSWCILRVM